MQILAGPASGQRLRVRFTGSGSEYFRIWIVNLLLTIVTLGFYYPWAKARRLAYFHGNTEVDGDALAFLGDPRKMLRGYLLVVLAWLLYLLASRLSPPLAAGIGVLFVLAWPALWRASLQFRLANTSWRGVRMQFVGPLAGAYRACVPLLPPLVLFAVGLALAPAGEEQTAPEGADLVIALLPLIAMLLMAALLPLWLAGARRYQHNHMVWGGEHSRLSVGTRAFYAWGARVLGLVLLVGLAVAALGFAWARGIGGPPAVVFSLSFVLLYLLMFIVVWPYAVARLQDLTWRHTASEHLQFCSALGARALMRRTALNLLFTVFTLGFYRPFAAVATARLRLEAVSLVFHGDEAEWRSRLAERVDDATGDFAGDFFGIDLGF